MENLFLTNAKVISIDDPDKNGKVQIQLLPEMKDVETSLLPWAIPFTTVISNSMLANDLPEEGSLVRVFVSQEIKMRRFYYLPNRFFESLFNFDSINSILGGISTINDKSYKNLKFRKYKDGGLEFHNNFTGEHGFISKTGSYNFHDKDGKIYVYSPSDKIIIQGSNVEINGNSKNFVTWSELNTALQSMITAINLTFASKLDTPGTPGTISLDITTAKTSTVKTG